MQFSIEINGVKTVARSGETILTVLQRNGIKIPTLCHMQGFSPTGSCRMCVVEVDGYDGLVPACSQLVEEWMQIRTHSSSVIKARQTIVELLLANHPDDCLYCGKTGSCELQKIAIDLDVRERKYHARKPSVLIDRNCPSIERNPGKCILCGRCIRVCDEIIGVGAIEIIGRGSNSTIGTSYNNGLNINTCVKCGQCITVCPTNALKEKSNYQQVIESLNDKNIYPVIGISHSVAVAIAEEYGVKPGKDLTDKLTSALYKTGFMEVHDLTIGSDIYALEMAGILADKIQAKDKSVVFTGNCPAFTRYIENSRPEFSANIAGVATPNTISASAISSFQHGKEKVMTVIVTPCTVTKSEPEFTSQNENQDYVVLTTRELILILKHYGIDLPVLEPEITERTKGPRGSAGRLSEIAGGTTEGIIRSLWFRTTGQELNPYKINELRNFKGRKEYRLKIGKSTYTFVAVSGLQNVKSLLDEIAAGRNDILMAEVMACPGGCVNGGGQRLTGEEKVIRNRVKAVYDADDEEMIKAAHKNPGVSEIYPALISADIRKKGAGE